MKLFELPGTLSDEGVQDSPQQRNLVITTMRQYAPILEHVEFYQMVGNADTPRKGSTASGGQTRAIDADYPDNKITPAFDNVALKVFGDKVQVDMAHVRRGQDVGSLMLSELASFAKNLGRNFQNALVNYAVASDPLEFDGILAATPSSRVTSFGVALTSDSAAKSLVEAIKSAIISIGGGATFVMMDELVHARISSYAAGTFTYAPNGFGGRVPTIDGIPIVVGGQDANGNAVLPWTSGTGSNATKVIVGRFGEKSDMTCATNVGVHVKYLGLVGVHYTTNVEFDVDFALLDNNAVKIIDEIKAS